MTWSDGGHPRYGPPPDPPAAGETVRRFAVLFAVLASLGAGLSLLAWIYDAGRQVPCTGGAIQVVNIQTVAMVVSAVLLLVGLALLAASLWRGARGPAVAWVLIGAASVVGLASFALISGAVAFHHGNVSSCWNF